MRVLLLNAGSSSLKATLMESPGPGLPPRAVEFSFTNVRFELTTNAAQALANRIGKELR